MSRISFILCLLLAFAPSLVFARLGEAPYAMQQRYGQPTSTTDVQDLLGVTCRQYQKNGFLITVYYVDQKSALEIFAARGLSQDKARDLVNLVAARSVSFLGDADESALRKASGITSKDVILWTWPSPALPAASIYAAYNSIECTLSFFADPQLYSRIQKNPASGPSPTPGHFMSF